MHIDEAKKQLSSQIAWLCDTMDNDLKHALGNAPNSEFVVDPQGKLIVARQWSRPSELRSDLAKLVGKVTDPTSVDDLNLKRVTPRNDIPKGVVPRISLPGRMTPCIVKAEENPGSDPFYVKLRAELDASYFQSGSGKLYLGFFLDPLYEVHWNNRAAAIEFEIDAPEQIAVTPVSGRGPDVKEDADADPREFIVDVTGRSNESIALTVNYFACDNAETFCKPVTQQYVINLVRDKDGGSRRAASSLGRGRPPIRGNLSRPEGRAGSEFTPADNDRQSEQRRQLLKRAVAIMRRTDNDGDGKLNASERAKVDIPLDVADKNSDGMTSLSELIDSLEARAGR